MRLMMNLETIQRLRKARRALHLHADLTESYKFDAVQELGCFFQASSALGMDLDDALQEANMTGRSCTYLANQTSIFMSKVESASQLANELRAFIKAVDLDDNELNEHQDSFTDEKIDRLIASSRDLANKTLGLFDLLEDLTHDHRKNIDWGVTHNQSSYEYKTIKEQIQGARKALDAYLLTTCQYRWTYSPLASSVAKQLITKLGELDDLSQVQACEIDLESLPPLIEELSNETSLIKRMIPSLIDQKHLEA